MIKLLYKPLGLAASVLGGVLAGAIFKRLWKLTARQDEAPRATDAGRGWREILIAAAAQGAVFGLVKAAVDRSAEGTRKLTGTWPRRLKHRQREGAGWMTDRDTAAQSQAKA